MSLTVTHLNGDASFLLSLRPKQPPGREGEAFYILLDPWLTGESRVLHSKTSVTKQKAGLLGISLDQLPVPDLVVISHHQSDHCNEATLRQLPARGTKTRILAEPTAARVIRNWKHFDESKVKTIGKWANPRSTGRSHAVRIPVPAQQPGGELGEVTVAFIASQSRDRSALQSAIGITYRPPPPSLCMPTWGPRPSLAGSRAPPAQQNRNAHRHHQLPLPTPPATPLSAAGPAPEAEAAPGPKPGLQQGDSFPPTPTSPDVNPLCLVRPASSLARSHVIKQHSSLESTRPTQENRISTALSLDSLTSGPRSPSGIHYSRDSPLSVIFAPHGIDYSTLHPYVTSHLISEAALPLTALLHCFDVVSSPWWTGGPVLLGAPAAVHTACRLGARACISAHDGDKDVSGFAAGLQRKRKWQVGEVRNLLDEMERDEMEAGDGKPAMADADKGLRAFDKVRSGMRQLRLRSSGGLQKSSVDHDDRKKNRASLATVSSKRAKPKGATTEVMALGAGRQVVVTSAGVCGEAMALQLPYWLGRSGQRNATPVRPARPEASVSIPSVTRVQVRHKRNNGCASPDVCAKCGAALSVPRI